ncbi:MAG: S1/P1 nuclease [Anaeromyxobacteraceae bacterium]
MPRRTARPPAPPPRVRALAALAIVATLVPVGAARAWGPDGHVVVTAVAEARLSPEARALVAEAAGGAALSDPDLATWADRNRDRATARWHYVNIPFGSTYDPARDCPRGDCAVAAIGRAREALAGARDPAARLEALRWLVHLVADLHQPVHAGDGFDRGGNELRVRVGNRREPTNLHKVLDGETVKAVLRGRPAREVGRALAARLDPAQARAWAAELDPAAWANASSREAQDIYRDLGLTPRTRAIVALPRGWTDAWRARTEAALLAAGVRLAALLDAAARESAARPVTR